MAEVVMSIGKSMLEGVLGGLAEKLSASIYEELGLQFGVREEMRYIREELEMMKACLQSAEENQESDVSAKTWIKQLRELAYDVEDCIEGFTLHLSHSNGCLKACSLNVIGARHRIAREIQDIKVRVEDLSKRRSKYLPVTRTNLQEASSSWSTIAGPTRHVQHDPHRLAALFVEEAQLVGIDKPRDILLGWLGENEPQLRVVAVVGMGGLGKTTLVRKTYQSPSLNFSCQAWITVSQSFEIHGLLRRMAMQLSVADLPTDMEHLIQKLRDHLKDKRYVIVFDDVWAVDAWDSLKLVLPNNQLGSRVIVTTRNQAVAYSCRTETSPHIYELEPLSHEDSWQLFRKKAFDGPEHACPPNLKDLSNSILKKCGGLPLAIVIISGLLASKPINAREHEWQMVYNHLGSEMERSLTLEGMKQILLLSYNDLPYYLKRCFLYLSIFPEDFVIRCKRVQRMWQAEGFIRAQHNMTTDEVAESYFDEFTWRSLIQPSKISADGKSVKSFRIHDIMLEVIVSKSREENVVSFLNSNQEIAALEDIQLRRLSIHLSDRYPNLEHIPEYMTTSTTLLSHIRTLSILRNLPHIQTFKVQPPFGSYDMLRMSMMDRFLFPTRMLTVFRDGSPSLLSARFRLLLVLDLEGFHDLKFHQLMLILELRQLKYIRLTHSRLWVSWLPETLGNLHNLETLDISGLFDLQKLPVGIARFQKLRYLRVSRTGTYSRKDKDNIVSWTSPKVPKSGIGKLTALQTLQHVDVRGRIGAVKELGMLTQLQKLGVTGLRSDNMMEFCASLEKLGNCLRSLKVSATDSGTSLDSLNLISSPPLLLRRLQLCGHLSSLPGWVGLLINVAKIHLHSTRLGNDALQVLQALPNLTILLLDGDAFCAENLYFDGGFPSLEALNLLYTLYLDSVIFQGGAAKLERIEIIGCETQVFGMENLSHLKEISLHGVRQAFRDSFQRAVEALPSPRGVTFRSSIV